MRFRVCNKGDTDWWKRSPEDLAENKEEACIFDSDDESDVENVLTDYNKREHVIKIVNEYYEEDEEW